MKSRIFLLACAFTLTAVTVSATPKGSVTDPPQSVALNKAVDFKYELSDITACSLSEEIVLERKAEAPVLVKNVLDQVNWKPDAGGLFKGAAFNFNYENVRKTATWPWPHELWRAVWKIANDGSCWVYIIDWDKGVVHLVNQCATAAPKKE